MHIWRTGKSAWVGAARNSLTGWKKYARSRRKAMEIFSIRQLYHSLKYDKELYPPGQLDSMAALAEPMERHRVWFVGEREIQIFTLNEMEQVLPQMFPDTVVQPDQWDTENGIADTPQATDGIQIKAGKEADYRAYVEKNSEDFYSLGVLEYMERWGKMMEDAIAQRGDRCGGSRKDEV